MRPKDVGRAVIVRSRFGSWRGVLVSVYLADPRCRVRPTEPGKGWSTEGLELPKNLVDFDCDVPVVQSRAALRLVEGGRAL